MRHPAQQLMDEVDTLVLGDLDEEDRLDWWSKSTEALDFKSPIRVLVEGDYDAVKRFAGLE